jgi:hypothetical protein
VADEAFAGEAAVRRRLRWHEVANSLVILLFALAIVAVAAFVVTRSDAWHRHRRAAASEPAVVTAPAPAKPVPRVTAPAAATPPRVAETATVAKPPPPKPAPPKASAVEPKQPKSATTPPEPRIRLAPPEPTVATEEPAELSAMDRPSGPAAKQMLNSIKCFDEFEFDFRARGRQYFSALCKGGNRKQVSCAGAGCKIEYARPPSHVPTGQ